MQAPSPAEVVAGLEQAGEAGHSHTHTEDSHDSFDVGPTQILLEPNSTQRFCVPGMTVSSLCSHHRL